MYDDWDQSAKAISNNNQHRQSESYLSEGADNHHLNLINEAVVYSAKNKIRVVIESYYSPQQTELWNVTKV